MHSDTLVTLPDITAAQRQQLIALLERAARDERNRARDERAGEITRLAHALDLHMDAVPAPPLDPSDALRSKDYDAWYAQPRCDAEHANLRTYMTYGCTRRGEHHAHLDVLGDEWAAHGGESRACPMA